MAAMGRVGGLVLVFLVVSVAGQSSSELTKAFMAKDFVGILGAIESAGLLPTLESFLKNNTATIFAPKDNFYPYHVDTGVLQKLKTDRAFLTQILQFHVIPGVLLRKPWATFGAPYEAIKEGRSSYPTLGGFPLEISRSGRKVTVDKSPGRFLDQIVLGNLVVHGINGLLIPPSLLQTVVLTNVSCVKANQCPRPPPPPFTPPPQAPGPQASPPSPSTVAPGPLGPVAPGPLGPVIPAPSPAEGPSGSPSPGTELGVPSPAPAPGPGVAENEIIAALTLAGTYNSLLAVVKVLKLGPYVDTLAREGKVTILAPNDGAFSALPSDLQFQLLQTNVSQGVDIVKGHVVRVYVNYDTVRKGSLLYTADNQQSLGFNVTTVGVPGTPPNLTANFIESPTILDDTANGISILGIDRVIVPATLPAPPPQSTGSRSAPKFAVSFILLLIGLLAV